jgi:large subunit ribosomal protein L29
MKIADINQKTDKELITLLIDSRKKLADAKVELRTKQISNVKEIMALRKTIARVLTVQRERELSKEEANG